MHWCLMKIHEENHHHLLQQAGRHLSVKAGGTVSMNLQYVQGLTVLALPRSCFQHVPHTPLKRSICLHSAGGIPVWGARTRHSN